MAFVVFFTDSKGAPAHRRVDSREDAVATVEHLRNDLEVTDAEIHRLSPVPLTFKTYYRVEVPDDEAREAPAAVAEPSAVDEPADHEQDVPVHEAVAEEPVTPVSAESAPVPSPSLPVPSPSIPFTEEGGAFGSAVPSLVPFDDDAIPVPRDAATGEPYDAVPGLLPEEPSLGYFAS